MALFCSSIPAEAQSGDNVLVVINEKSAASKQVGEYYVRKRAVPDSNVVRISTTEDEMISRLAFDTGVHAPIANAITTKSLQDRILYIVLTKGVPLRIQGTVGLQGTMASVDSELAVLYRRLTGATVLARGRVDNPYFLGQREIREARPFTHREQDVYLVSRLDAFTVADALAIIDRGLAAVTEGSIVLDQRASLVKVAPEDWLADAATRLTAEGHGDRVVLESTPKPARDVKAVLGYYSWGSVDPQNRVRAVKLGFSPGSLAATFAGADARTFREPPAAWLPAGNTGIRAGWYAGAPHSLIADLIREGATGVAGYVAEPYVQSIVRPDILFSAYLAGFNVVESFYLALPHLSWQSVIIGDPLCAPFPRKGPSTTDLKPDLDDRTELPAFFSTRRLDVAKATVRAKPDALVHLVLAESHLARDRTDEAMSAFERAVAADDTLAVAHLRLGMFDDQAGRKDAAIKRYRRVIELEPRNAMALNNLAYSLAVVKNQPAEARPFAERAVAAAPRDPRVLDTLGWIEHLLGNHQTAVKLLAGAARMAPRNAEIRLHTAFAVAAAGAPGAASSELQAALDLDPTLAKREDVQELRARLNRTLK